MSEKIKAYHHHLKKMDITNCHLYSKFDDSGQQMDGGLFQLSVWTRTNSGHENKGHEIQKKVNILVSKGIKHIAYQSKLKTL